jgi:hypothetical protein
MSLRRNLNAGRLRADAPGSAGTLTAQEPMTPEQASTLKGLAEQANESDAFDESIGKEEAALRITALKAKLAHQRTRRFDRFRG